MKKLFIPLALSLSGALSASPNLFSNPDFEDVLPDGRAKGWVSRDMVQNGGITGRALQACCSQKTSGNAEMKRAYLRQDFKKLLPGDYLISGYVNGKEVRALWVGTTSPVKGVGKMHWINAKDLEDDGLKENWRRFEFTLELKQEAALSFVLEVMGAPDSKCLLDKFSMTKL